MTDPSTFAPSDILPFWFSDAVKGTWFDGGESFDAELRHRFGGLLQRAKLGALAHWAENPDSALALVILLDQLSRNIHRGAPEAFATDPLGLETAKQAIAQGYDLRLTPEGRSFLYLPSSIRKPSPTRNAASRCSRRWDWRKHSTICAGTARSSRALDASRIAMPFSGASRRPRRSNF